MITELQLPVKVKKLFLSLSNKKSFFVGKVFHANFKQDMYIYIFQGNNKHDAKRSSTNWPFEKTDTEHHIMQEIHNNCSESKNT